MAILVIIMVILYSDDADSKAIAAQACDACQPFRRRPCGCQVGRLSAGRHRRASVVAQVSPVTGAADRLAHHGKHHLDTRTSSRTVTS